MSKGHGINFVELISGPEGESLASALLVVIVVATSGFIARKKLSSAANPLVPDSNLSMRNIFELLSLFILKLADTVMGENNRKYLPFLATLFTYLLSMNLLGLIPGFSMPTDSLTINLGIALTVFILYNTWGIREVGPVAYFKHLLGPIWLIAPLMLVIELISHVVRPLSLSLRLFGNMTGDHIVLSVFTDLTKFGVPVVFYGLGTFVCMMQAFVFTLLTMIYIRFAITHEEAHH